MNKRLSKVFSILLTFLLICSTVVVPIYADTPQRIELTSPTGTIKAGDVVEIPVILSNPNKLCGVQFSIKWDPTMLSGDGENCFVKEEPTNDIMKTYEPNFGMVADGNLIVNGLNSNKKLFDTITDPYKLGTLKLTVLDAAAGQTVKVTIDPDDTYGTDGSVDVDFADPVDASFTVEAAATTKHTVTFKNEDAVVKSFEVEDGKAIGAENMPADPTKEGYTFDGWFDGETPITAETVVTKNITATAKFTEKAPAAPQRIELTSPTGTIKAGDVVEIPVILSNPNKLCGVQFSIKWDPTMLSGDGENCFVKEEPTNDIMKTYEPNFGMVADGNLIVNGLNSNKKLFDTITDPYKLGTLKLTVLDAAAGQTVKVTIDPDDTYGTDGSVDVDFADPVDASFTVEAAATTKHTVTFKNEDAVVKSFEVEDGKAIGAENMPADPTKEGYTFDGWFDGETKITAETVVTGNIAATAKFTLIPPTQYAVTFKDGETTVDTVMVNKGETVTAEKMPKAPEKTGYTFKGWFIGEDEFTGDTVVNDNITVTAVYEINKYTVTFKDGENELGKADVDYNTAIGAANMPADPTKEGYTFDGWYDGETKITAETVVTGNITATAKFDVKSYQVTFDIDGTTEKVVTINYGDKIGDEMPADPVKEGYVFKGWFNGEEEITKDTEVKGSFTATAKFEEKVPENFTVTFVSDGKTVYTADILEGTTIGDANIPNDRVKDGYTFKGWFNGDDEVKADTTVTGIITVEAKFEVTPAEEIFSLGDADGSGEINGADIVLFRQKLLRRPVMVFDSSKDLYKDGEFDGNDVIRLAQYYAGLLDDSNIQITPAP